MLELKPKQQNMYNNRYMQEIKPLMERTPLIGFFLLIRVKLFDNTPPIKSSYLRVIKSIGGNKGFDFITKFSHVKFLCVEFLGRRNGVIFFGNS